MCQRVLRPAITFERFELGSTYTQTFNAVVAQHQLKDAVPRCGG